jgi:hypothetical protein
MEMATAEKWKVIIGEHQRSGLSAAQFCRELGHREHQLTYWRKKLAGAAGGGQFARVETGDFVALELPGGKTVKVRREDLAAVLEALCER